MKLIFKLGTASVFWLIITLMANSVVADEAKNRENYFSHNLGIYSAKTPDLAKAIKAIEIYNSAISHRDIDTIGRVLSANFRMFFLPDPKTGNTMFQDRTEFFERRSSWKKNKNPTHRAEISVKNLVRLKNGTVIVTTATTHKSRYFRPRFMEKYALDAAGEDFKLSALEISPSYPENLKDYKVNVYWAEMKEEYYDLSYTNLRRDISIIGPKRALSKYVTKLHGSVAPRAAWSKYVPLIAIFKEAPPDGTEIEIIEQQMGGEGRRFTNFTRVNGKGDPFFIMASPGWKGGLYSVAIEIKMNGEVIKRTRMKLAK